MFGINWNFGNNLKPKFMKKLLIIIAFFFVITATEAQNVVPESSMKRMYKHGALIEYYQNNGVTVAMVIVINKMYGKYYQVAIKIKNQTDKAFNFFPSNVKAFLNTNGQNFPQSILSYRDYMKKVRHRQNANALFAAMGENERANQAGYSSSYTNSNYSGNVGNTYGNVNVNGATRSYNGAASYAAHQKANQNIAMNNNQLVTIRNSINQGYLRTTTIQSGEQLLGYVNVKFKKAKGIRISVSVNGYQYWFGFSQ